MQIDDLFRLDEMTLYRGDASRIARFDSKKTGFLALFGAGIYLTDNPAVAADYTLKSSDHVLMRDSTSPRALIAYYLATIMRDQLNWRQVVEALIEKWSRALYDDPGYRAATGRDYDRGRVEAITQQYEAKLGQERAATLSKLLKQAKAIFKKEAAGLRVIKDTQGLWALVRADRTAYVSRFEIPDAYLARTLHAERPLPDKVLATIKRLWLAGRPDDQRFDMRDADGTFMTFDGWVRAYKTTGIMYAWATKDDDSDVIVSGHGQNPDFDTLRNGTHFGGSWFYSHGEQFAEAMQALGYVGLEYDGGKRIGSYVRGGGGITHRAFVLWNDDDINRFRVDVQKISAQDASIESTIANGIRVSTMLAPLRQVSG